MSQIKVGDRGQQVIMASSMFVICLASGHFLLACTGAVIAFSGVALGQQPACRKARKVVFLTGLLVVLIGMLFSTGYQMGKDMAHRDARLSSHSLGVTPR